MTPRCAGQSHYMKGSDTVCECGALNYCATVICCTGGTISESALLSEVADWLEKCAKTRNDECPRDDYHALNHAHTFASAYCAAAAALRDGSWRKD